VVLVGGNVNCVSKSGDAPLHVAALGAHEKVISYLLAHGAEKDKPSSVGHTPLHRGVFSLEKGLGSIKVLSLLLTHGCDPLLANDDGQTPLHLAVSCLDILDEATLACAHLMAVHGMDVTMSDMSKVPSLQYAIDARKPYSAAWFALKSDVTPSDHPELEALIRESGDLQLMKRTNINPTPVIVPTSSVSKPATIRPKTARRKGAAAKLKKAWVAH